MTASNFNKSTNPTESEITPHWDGRFRTYLDWDGTMTRLDGAHSASHPSYKNCQTNPNDWYSRCQFKPNIVELLKISFEQKDHPLKMGEEALTFIQEMLEKGADINIISRNLKAYIEAVLEAQGITQAQIKKMTIIGVNELRPYQFKGNFILEKEGEGSAKITIVCDDSLQDYQNMLDAVRKSSGNKTQIVSATGQPGQIDWTSISKDIQLKLQKLTGEEKKSSCQFFSKPQVSSPDAHLQQNLVNSLIEQEIAKIKIIAKKMKSNELRRRAYLSCRDPKDLANMISQLETNHLTPKKHYRVCNKPLNSVELFGEGRDLLVSMKNNNKTSFKKR